MHNTTTDRNTIETTASYTGYYYSKDELSDDFLTWQEKFLTLKLIKTGWNNPIKISLPKKIFLNNIKRVIRNQLNIIL